MDSELQRKLRQRGGDSNIGNQPEKPVKTEQKSAEDKQKARQKFLANQKRIQALFAKQNAPPDQTTLKKEEIHGNQENFSNARQLLEEKFAKPNTTSSNNSASLPGTLPPPPPSLPLNLPPPPPPPSLSNLPPPPPLNNLPPPPSLNTVNLPPPPSLNAVNLPPPPSLNAVNKPQNAVNPPKNYETKTNTAVLPPPPPSSVNNSNYNQSKIPQHRTSNQQIPQQQNRAQEACFIINNSSTKTSSQMPYQPPTQMPYQPPTQMPYQPPTQMPYQPPTQVHTKVPTSTQRHSNMPKAQSKKHIFFRQRSETQAFSSKFFKKNVTAFIKRQFTRQADILDVIDTKISKKVYSFSFPSIQTGLRQIQLIETFYADISNLDLVSCYMQKNLNAVKPHNDARSSFIQYMKNYNWNADEKRFKTIIQMVQSVPQMEYKELNFVRIKNAMKRCDNLINGYIKLQQFEKCSTMKKLNRNLQEMVSEYRRNPQQNAHCYQKIHELACQIMETQ